MRMRRDKQNRSQEKEKVLAFNASIKSRRKANGEKRAYV